MLLARDINRCMFLDAAQLENLLNRSGYKGDRVLRSEFMGLTNGGEFCYSALYKDIDGQQQWTKVFVNTDKDGELYADY